MASYRQPFAYRCQNLHDGELEVWLVVDGDERPDLLRRTIDGELTPPRCPKCGAEAAVRGRLSLLVRRPDKRPAIMFASATPQDGDTVADQARLSMMMLSRGSAELVRGDAIGRSRRGLPSVTAVRQP